MTTDEDSSSDQRGLRPVSGSENSASMPQGRHIIVVLGINDYNHWPILGNAVNDAMGIHKLFTEKMGFSAPVPPLLNADVTKQAIESLAKEQLRDILKPEDSLLLFFAGHGHTRVDAVGAKQIETGYIIPNEARTDHWSDYVEVSAFLEWLGKLPARHILVVLDACRSGFALGDAMKQFRSAVHYERELVKHVSRRVITSARRDEPALDSGGPIPGHSLFTGTLIDGFNWGRADTDGNGLVTSSELGLFLQQQVSQFSERSQIPDFGAFYLDDRGEMVFSLGGNTFDALKARAFATLQTGDMETFERLVGQILATRPEAPEALYLKYRLKFAQNDISGAMECIKVLFQLSYRERQNLGNIPLSQSDLIDLEVQLEFWHDVYSIPDQDSPLQVRLFTGLDEADLQETFTSRISNRDMYAVENGSIIRFRITNPTDTPLHIYLIHVSPDGQMMMGPLWPDDDVTFNGLVPGQTSDSYPFRLMGSLGIEEFRLFSSPRRIRVMLTPPEIPTRSVLGGSEITKEALDAMRMKAIRCLTGAL